MTRYPLLCGTVGVAALLLACSSADSSSSNQGLDGSYAEPGAGGSKSSEGVGASSGSSGSAGTVTADLPPPSADPGSHVSASGGTSSGSAASTGGTGTGGSGAIAGTTSASPPTPSDPGTGSGGVQPGTLTAGTWDDNLNFDFFTSYRKLMDAAIPSGLLPVTLDEYAAAHALYAQTGGAKDTLDIALVIDTTGSMGDEMKYLQTEFSALATTIENRHPNAEQRWSLIVYRDVTDDYVVRSFDFDGDKAKFQQNLAAQSAAGGGDFPEAPDQALAAVPNLAWRLDDSTARLAFWVADAPNHTDKNTEMVQAIEDVGALGVHVYPVASSGIDENTELLMRSAAELTGGRYLFLTDDSGVGDSHKEPTIPCYFVTKLDAAIERMVDIELSGVYQEPAAADIIRTGGNPQSGACELDSGDSVLVY